MVLYLHSTIPKNKYFVSNKRSYSRCNVQQKKKNKTEKEIGKIFLTFPKFNVSFEGCHYHFDLLMFMKKRIDIKMESRIDNISEFRCYTRIFVNSNMKEERVTNVLIIKIY